jgi:hypothetical protein
MSTAAISIEKLEDLFSVLAPNLCL